VSRVSLLDVNVMVALFDSNHIYHEIAHDWFTDSRADRWATCPATENGFLRVLTSPAAGLGLRPAELVERLRLFCASGHHVFWPDAVSLRDKTLFNPSFVQGHRQVTDIYLLGLAKKMGGRFATLDRAIPLGAIVGARRDLIAVISPVAGN
jgi:uncharacterized protein